MVYCFLAQGFEEIEALTPVDILRRAGVRIETVGVGGKSITGSHGITVTADITESEVRLDDELEMVLLPGGMPGTLNLKASDTVKKAIGYCAANDRYLAAICAAPLVLGHLSLLIGKRATCYSGFEKDLLGAQVTGEPVCVDGKIITARGAGVAMSFALKLAAILTSEEKSAALADSMLCE